MPKLNEAVVKALPTLTVNKLYPFAGAVVQGAAVPRGFFVRVTMDGTRAFVMDYRIGGRQRRYTIGRSPDWSALAAVQEARKLRQRIDRGEDPLGERKDARALAARPEPAKAKTVADVLDEFMAGFKGRRLRRPDNYTDAFNRLVKPAIGSLPVHGLKRSHVAAMLDKIEANNGPVMADRTHTYLSSAVNWFAGQDDDFAMPMLKGLKRATAQRRDRVLSDEEIRLLLRAAETEGTFGAAVRLLLLTGQRRGDVLGMAWEELDGTGAWTIPASRYKTGQAHTVELSRAALAIIEAQPRTGRLVFPDRDGEVCNTIGFRKLRLDRAIAALNDRRLLPRWTLHDLRRTARSLMPRAGVRPDIAERVVGHVIRGVEGVYDRHTYAVDKRAALEALARLIADILDPQPANVVPLRQAAAQ